eukprot:9645589-Karenia_brevis.AAC.1
MAVGEANDLHASSMAGMSLTMDVGNYSGNQSFSSILFCSSSVASAQEDLPETKPYSMKSLARSPTERLCENQVLPSSPPAPSDPSLPE